MTLTTHPYVGYAKLIGTIGSGLLAGGQICVSHVTVPAILACGSATASQLQAQWQHVYDIGKVTAPSVAALSSAALLFAAWGEYERALPGSSPWPWTLSAGLSVAIVPFTFIFMRPNVRALQSLGYGRADQKSNTAQVRGLISEWSKLHAVRIAMNTAGFGLAVWALVCE